MSVASNKVVVGFTKLSSTDQQAVAAEISRYLKAKPSEQQEIQENFSKQAGVELGPLNSGKCPCCNK